MSRNKDYQKLLNSKRWKQLRVWKLQQDPLCEICRANGRIVSAIDVHHIEPCEDSRSLAEMEEKCFRVSNLQALCIPCHQRVHREANSHSLAAHQQRESERLERWKAKHDQKNKPPRPV